MVLKQYNTTVFAAISFIEKITGILPYSVVILPVLPNNDQGSISVTTKEIFLRQQVESRMVKTLFHEVIHALQFQSGRWIIYGNEQFFNGVNITKIPYSMQPHEQQANQFAMCLWWLFYRYYFHAKNISK